MRPETWAPTRIVPRADSVPFPVTCAAMLPLVTGTVLNVTGAGPFCHGFLIHRAARPPTTIAIAMIRGSQRLITTHLLECEAAQSCRGRDSSREKHHHRARERYDARAPD